MYICIGYNGNLTVSFSKVHALTGPSSTSFAYNDLVADPACFDVGPTDAANSCGIHLHSLVNPDLDACAFGNIGGHYWVNASDPWMTVNYNSSAGFVQLDDRVPDSTGKALVIHDQTGARIACTTFASLDVDSLRPLVGARNGEVPAYPGYSGWLIVGIADFQISQLIGSSDQDDLLHLSWSSVNADHNCFGVTNPAANSCGIHLHTGFGCPSDAAGGHLFPIGGVDPWLIARYGYDSFLDPRGALILSDTGYSVGTPAVLVIHNVHGDRIGCLSICGSTSVPFSDKADPGAINGYADSSVTVTCNSGYSTSETDPTASTATAVCDVSGQFSLVTCYPVVTEAPTEAPTAVDAAGLVAPTVALIAAATFLIS